MLLKTCGPKTEHLLFVKMYMKLKVIKLHKMHMQVFGKRFILISCVIL